MRSSWIEVDLDALRRNTEFVKSRIASGTKFLAAVKGNAYGHGAVPCAKVFEEQGADYLGVAIAEEGKELRENGIQLPILIFGTTFPDCFDLLFDYDLIPNVFTEEQAEELNKMALERGTKLTIHISVDTGLSRLGFVLNETLTDTIQRICEMPGLKVEGLFSMLATSEFYPDTEYAQMQFDKFNKLYDELVSRGVEIPLRHICEGGGTVCYPQYHMEMVRPGTPLYGMACVDNYGEIQGNHMWGVMSVKSRLACIRPVKTGTYAGYGISWQAQRDSVLAVVPLGFVDGVSRIASGRGFVLVHGRRCPIIGKVCMDQMTIDITDIEDPQIGDEVVVMGRQGDSEITVAEAGGFAGTTDTEYSCRMGRRLPIYYIGEKAEEYAGAAALSAVLNQ